MVSSEGSTGEESPSKPLWFLAGFSSLGVVGLWTSVLSWLLPWGHLLHGSLRHQSMLVKKAVKSASNMEVTISCNLLMEMTSHQLCHILWIRRKSQTLPILKGEDYPRTPKARGGRIGGHFTVYLLYGGRSRGHQPVMTVRPPVLGRSETIFPMKD